MLQSLFIKCWTTLRRIITPTYCTNYPGLTASLYPIFQVHFRQPIMIILRLLQLVVAVLEIPDAFRIHSLLSGAVTSMLIYADHVGVL
jgi:hypothetical protein